MGIRILFTSIVVFIFSLCMFYVVGDETQKDYTEKEPTIPEYITGLMALVSLIMIPVSLIMIIWGL